MLRHLEIRNYALIEHLEMDFDNGFSVITGETGAGKSIIMGALSLVLGQRADAKSIQEGHQKCVIETLFDISGYRLESFFAEADIDFDTNCIIRREVHSNGKSRAFINDTPVSLAQLKTLTEQLIDIHSQHESLLLSNTSFQLNIVDFVANVQTQKATYKELYDTYKTCQKTYTELSKKGEQWKTERDYDQYQFDQLDTAQLTENEQIDLEAELELLNHTEEVKSELSSVLNAIDQDDIGIQQQLAKASQSLERIKKFLPTELNASGRIKSSLIDIKDLSKELSDALYNTEFNAERKKYVEERLDFIFTLEQKHRVGTVPELLEIRRKLENKLLQIEAFDSDLAQMEQQITSLREKMEQASKELSKKRRSVTETIQKDIVGKLTQLGIANAQFVVQIVTQSDFTPTGQDNVEFLFAANKNAAPQSIAKVASGGEISRLMLSIKSLLINASGLPTIIFDEIDTGVSGEIAHKMGEIMRQISHSSQVIAISHLPQIAAKGTTHYKVYKQDNEKSTQTHIVRLNTEERQLEIAEMLSGKSPSAAAIENARELLAQ